MSKYPSLPNGAKTNLSNRSWIKIEPNGVGTIRCYDTGQFSTRLGIQYPDLLPLGLSARMALDQKRNSFIRDDGRLLTVVPGKNVSPSFRTGIGLMGDKGWGYLELASTYKLLDFCMAVLKKLAIIPVTIGSFSSTEIITIVKQQNIQLLEG